MTFKKYLKNNRWTFAELSRRTGISERMLHYIADGKYSTNEANQVKIAKVLGISKEELQEMIK